MKRFKVERAKRSIELNNACVEVSTCVAVGGGAI